MEEEIQALEETTLEWQTNDRLTALHYTVATLLSNEPTNDEIMKREMAVTKSTLLETVLMTMKDETITFSNKTKRKSYKNMERLKTDLTTANNSEQVDHDKERRIEAEIAECEDGDIREALEKQRSFEVFDDKKPLPPFKDGNIRRLQGGDTS